MKNVNQKQRSRMNNYQTSDPPEDFDQHNRSHDSPRFEPDDAEDPNQVEILFDPNEALAGFGNPSKQREQNYKSSAYQDNDDDNYVGEKMGSGNSSGFFEHEDAFEQPMAEPKHYSSVKEPSDVQTTDFEEIDKGFNIQNDDFQNVPENVQVYNPVPETQASSFANYQISSMARAANKRKPPPLKNKLVNKEPPRSNKPEILNMHNDDIGEVGEWVGRSANVNRKNEDSDDDDDDEEKNKSDDFEGVFEQTEPAALNKEKAAARNKNREDDEEEEERGEKFQNVDQMANFQEQSSRAMQKAQGSALRNANNRGPFANNLKEKARNLQTKAQDKVMAVNDGEIKLKNEAPKENFAEEDEEEEVEFDTRKLDVQSQQKGHVVSIARKAISLDHRLEDDEELFEQKNKSPQKIEEEEGPQGLDDIMDLDSLMNKQSPIKKDEKVVSPASPDEWEAVSKKTAQEVNKKSISKKKEEMISPKSPQDEWEAVSKATAKQITVKKEDEKITLVRFDQVWQKIKDTDLSQQRLEVQQDIQASQSFFQKLFGACTGSGLPDALTRERDQALAFAKLPVHTSEPWHFEILQTLYIKLTGFPGQVSRYGDHWEMIGFQGRDPATDFRGVGQLGLIQLLAFVSENEKLFKKMWERSIHDKYNFPLSICGLSVTQTVMEVVRAGKLNGNINSKRSAIAAMNEAYFAAFYKLYNIYETNAYTIEDYPKAKNAAFEMFKASPNVVINEYKLSGSS